MRLHTTLTSAQVHDALDRAQQAGHITRDVHFAVWGSYSSRTHPRAFEVQLGTFDKFSLPPGTVDQHGKRMRVRRFKNSGSHGATSEWNHGEDVWAATWHEWGWFIAEVFAADPLARFGGNPERSRYPQYVWGYFSPEDFHVKTDGRFRRQVTGAEVAAVARAHPEWASPEERVTATEARRSAACLPGPSLDPVVFGPESHLGTAGW